MTYRPIRDEEIITRDLPKDFLAASRVATRNVEHAVNGLIDDFEKDLKARVEQLKADTTFEAEIKEALEVELRQAHRDLGAVRLAAENSAKAITALMSDDATASAALENEALILKQAADDLKTVLDQNLEIAGKMGTTAIEKAIGLISGGLG